jgi:LCP family protein required for cell wall assembly
MRKVLRLTLLGCLGAALVVAVWTGYEVRTVYTDVSATYHPAPRITQEPKATPVTNFFGNHRINVLLLGSDNDQKFQQLYPLTQSMIVVSIDPVHDKVGLLSIPRDFWIPIPGYGMGKIDGAAEHGGTSLARATVESLFHINVDYYAWVGLGGFSHVVDDFGGVTVDVTHPILDDFYPNDVGSADPYAYTRLFIPAGWHHLSGRQALDYVRSRHGDAVGDFGRSDRQQQVLLQLQKKANGWNLLFKIPQLAHDLSGMIRTDLSSARLLDVARLSRHIRPPDITRLVLSAPKYCQYSQTSDGQSILEPDWQAIRPVVSRLFAPIRTTPPPGPVQHGTATPSLTATPTPTSRPTATPAPSLTATTTPPTLEASHLPGKLIYAAGGTFYQMDRNRHVTDIMPSWMSAAGMPAVSANGKNLAFVRWSPEASDIYTYNLQTRQTPTQITNDATPDPPIVNDNMWVAWPAWSADRKTILFSSDRYKLAYPATDSRMLDLAIYAASADGSNVRQLTTPSPGAGGDTDPQLLGHSSKYLYDHWAYHHQNGLAVGQPYSQLQIRALTNPNAVWTLTPPSEHIVQPALDRSGSRLAYVGEHGSTSTLVVAHIVDTKHGPRLRDQKTIASGEIAQPTFTPNGRWISYLQADGNGFDIYLMPAQGGPSMRLGEAGTGVDATSRPVWIP